MTTSRDPIPFNRPYMTGNELSYIRQAHEKGQLAGDGVFSKQCQEWLEARIGCSKALLTHSCTTALEMATLLADIRPGDEIIMPSYTFVSTANAFVLRGAIPVFVDIRPDTLNIDEIRIEGSITDKTRVIVPMHYAGVGCEMDPIMAIADASDLLVGEDAAQGVLGSYRGRPLGGFGQLAGVSFHETKNVISGEGGALLINDDRFAERAEIIRDKGTNRNAFLQGQVKKYTWVDVGSSYLPSELTAAFLWAQLEEAEDITARRLEVWNEYHSLLAELEDREKLRRPAVPEHSTHNAHTDYVLLREASERPRLLQELRDHGIHYVPLHSSPAGRRCTRTHGSLEVTESVGACVARLPLWVGFEDASRVATAIYDFFRD
jgi:dTDP-4-amino-4,6-dideoxygalactose transaminase